MKNPVSIDRYSNFERIGRGGFSDVYKAWREDQNRFVAVKILAVGSRREFDREAFAAECRAMGTVASHPNVVTVFDNGFTNEGYPFIAMELCRDSLADRIKAAPNQCLPVDDVLAIGTKILLALDRAHREGILHRDLKPQNILFTEYEPVLTDFGISSLSDDAKSQKSWALSRHYAAPEVLNDDNYTQSCDIYSLGATLYSALAGHRPFSDPDNNEEDALEKRIREQAPPPMTAQAVPPFVEDEIRRLIAKHPRDRPDTAGNAAQLLYEIRRQLGTTPIQLPVEASREEDPTELRNKRPKARAPVDSTSPADLTKMRGTAGDRETKDFEVHPDKSNRPKLAAIALLVVLLAGLGGVALARDTTTSTTPDPGSTPLLPDTDPEITVVTISRSPSTPQDVMVTRNESEVTVSWSAVTGAARYRLDPQTLGMPSSTVTDTRATFALKSAEIFCVVVRAIGESGALSPESEQACA